MITVTRRDNTNITFEFYDEDGAVVNLTGATLFVTVKQNITDADASAKIATTLTVTDPALGIALWEISPSDTQYLSGYYFLDIQLVDSFDVVTTLLNDILEVVPDVTIRVA